MITQAVSGRYKLFKGLPKNTVIILGWVPNAKSVFVCTFRWCKCMVCVYMCTVCVLCVCVCMCACACM